MQRQTWNIHSFKFWTTYSLQYSCKTKPVYALETWLPIAHKISSMILMYVNLYTFISYLKDVFFLYLVFSTYCLELSVLYSNGCRHRHWDQFDNHMWLFYFRVKGICLTLDNFCVNVVFSFNFTATLLRRYTWKLRSDLASVVPSIRNRYIQKEIRETHDES